MSKTLTVRDDVIVELLERDHTLIVSDRQAVVFRCTLCGGTKDIFPHDAQTPLPCNMRTCMCGLPAPQPAQEQQKSSVWPEAGTLLCRTEQKPVYEQQQDALFQHLATVRLVNREE